MSIARSFGRHSSRSAPFARHLLEMVLAMMIGMIASAAVFLSAVGMTAGEALRQHAVLFVVVQASGMTVAMVAWMRYRGHAWRGCSVMAAAMIVPAVALICLRLAGIISGPICGAYCALTFVAMVLVMLYRRSDYGGIATAVPAR
jgi:hypothetical protein